MRSIPLETSIAIAGLATVAIQELSKRHTDFYFEKDGYFGWNTHSGGMDKLGHAFTTYMMTNLLAERIRSNSDHPAGAAFTAGLLSMGVMTGVEVLDGFSPKYGFSRQDLAADAVGAAFGMLRASWPALKNTVDFRFMYTPEAYERYSTTRVSRRTLLPPYRRQRYILALKGSGFDYINQTPLRFAELQFGYDARGFHASEREIHRPKERNFYVGVGLNLNEILFSPAPFPNLANYRETEPAWAAQKFFEYVQLPYTAYYGRADTSRRRD